MPLQLVLKLNSYFVSRINVQIFQLLSPTLSSMSPRVRMVPLVSTKLVCIARKLYREGLSNIDKLTKSTEFKNPTDRHNPVPRI